MEFCNFFSFFDQTENLKDSNRFFLLFFLSQKIVERIWILSFCKEILASFHLIAAIWSTSSLFFYLLHPGSLPQLSLRSLSLFSLYLSTEERKQSGRKSIKGKRDSKYVKRSKQVNGWQNLLSNLFCKTRHPSKMMKTYREWLKKLFTVLSMIVK